MILVLLCCVLCDSVIVLQRFNDYDQCCKAVTSGKPLFSTTSSVQLSKIKVDSKPDLFIETYVSIDSSSAIGRPEHIKYTTVTMASRFCCNQLPVEYMIAIYKIRDYIFKRKNSHSIYIQFYGLTG